MPAREGWHGERTALSSVLGAGAAADDEAAGEQRDAGEQHRDRGEAGERQLVRGLAGLDLAGRLGDRRRRGGCVPGVALLLRGDPAAGRRRGRLLLGGDARRRTGRRSQPFVFELIPLIARLAPVMLISRAPTSMDRMARRDFIRWLLRDGRATLARARCLIWSSSSGVASGRFSRRSRMTSSNSVIAH